MPPTRQRAPLDVESDNLAMTLGRIVERLDTLCLSMDDMRDMARGAAERTAATLDGLDTRLANLERGTLTDVAREWVEHESAREQRRAATIEEHRRQFSDKALLFLVTGVGGWLVGQTHQILHALKGI